MNDRQRAASSNSGSEPAAIRLWRSENKMRGFRCPHSFPRPSGARHPRERLKASRSRQRDDNPNRSTCGMSRKNHPNRHAPPQGATGGRAGANAARTPRGFEGQPSTRGRVGLLHRQELQIGSFPRLKAERGEAMPARQCRALSGNAAQRSVRRKARYQGESPSNRAETVVRHLKN